MSLGNTFETELAAFLAFDGTSLPGVGASFWLALVNGDPGEEMNLVGELSGNGYARIEMPRNVATFNQSEGVISNIDLLSFSKAIDADWTFTHAVVCKANTGDNGISRVLVSGSGSVTIPKGRRFDIEPGGFRWTIN